MEWTPENRLRLIAFLAQKQVHTKYIDMAWQHAQAIIFISTKSDEWLKRNRRNFADEIAQMEQQNP